MSTKPAKPKPHRFTTEEVKHIEEALRDIERARRACQSLKEFAEWANNIERGADRPSDGRTAEEMTAELRLNAMRYRLEAIENARQGIAVLRTVGPRAR